MIQRTTIVNVDVFGVTGPDGVLQTAVVGDSSNEVYFRILDENDHYIEFEDEARYLYNWCQRHDFDYYEKGLEIEVALELIND